MKNDMKDDDAELKQLGSELKEVVAENKLHNRKVQDNQKMAEEKVRVLEKNPGVGDKENCKGEQSKCRQRVKKLVLIRRKKLKITNQRYSHFVGGGGGVLGPSGNLPTNPIKQGIKGGAPKVTKKQPFCSVGG